MSVNIKAGTDALFGFGAVAAATFQSRATPNVWMYRYDHTNQDVTFLDGVNTAFNLGIPSYVANVRRPSGRRIFPGECTLLAYYYIWTF